MHIFLSIISIPKQGTAKNHTMEDVEEIPTDFIPKRSANNFVFLIYKGFCT